MKKEKKNYFISNKNNIDYVGNQFLKVFGKMEFEIPKKLKLKIKVLEKDMNNKEILAEFRPKESTLGELVWAMKNEERMLRNGYSNIFYIRDKEKILWAVVAGWFSFRRGWSVGAGSVEDPVGWDQGSQVVSQVFNSSAFGSLDSLDLVKRVKILEDKISKVERIINL